MSLRIFKPDGYLLALLGAIVLALMWPAPGASGGLLHLERMNQIGIALIFFLHGAVLSPQTLRAESGRWRVHMLIQSITFLIFPAICFVVYWCGASWLPYETRLGIFFLGVLSSTISSSIAMTAIALGNVPIAIFNATLSGLLGLFVTPFFMALLMTLPGAGSDVAAGLSFGLTLHPEDPAGAGHAATMADAFVRILRLLLLPLLAGQLFHPLIGRWLQARKRTTGLFERTVIVLIVLNAFSNATAGGLWSQYSLILMLSIGMIVVLLLFAILALCKWISRLAGLSRTDEAAFVFCGSTKSLANAAPMAQIMFGASPMGGMILLPIVLYHQLQLVVIAIMARSYARAALLEPASARVASGR
ncbi:bile acid:sodium symporter family protein [Steroidobacter denitrificans]|uniref:bile acid:sodium symporter family protein n=1 Tax=Steroidobacter denitrificans TaxID=465721 RepID=UPI0012ED7F8C|nr:bile acid:sodium symporter family protein [Steroidobacter denitrificans]